MSLRKLHKEKVCAKETIVLSFPVEKLKGHLTCTRFIFSPPFFYDAQAKQNHAEVYWLSVIQSKMMHTPQWGFQHIPLLQEELPCLLNRVRTTHLISVFCSEAGESALHTELAGGRWSTFPQELWNKHFRAAGSAVRACAPVSRSITLSKPIQSHLVSLCLSKGLFCPKTKTTPPSTLLSVHPVMQKTE